jgi:hypothetical protein
MNKDCFLQLSFEEMELQNKRAEINKRLRALRKEKKEVFTQCKLDLEDNTTNQEGGSNG